jgi:type VI secretion system protein ImpF
MRRGNLQSEFTPSVLDRLITPKAKGEIGELRPGSLEALEASLRRDLTVLCNTRTAREPVPGTYPEAASSLLVFGIPDLVGQNLRQPPEQNRLRRSIENAIRLFEPRLTAVSVTVETWDEAKPYLRFHIDAYVKTDGGSQPVSFDTVFRSDTGRFVVQEQRV